MEGWVGRRAGLDVEKKWKLLPLSGVEPQHLHRAAGLQVTLRCSVPWFISASPDFSPHMNGVPNGTALAAVRAVFSCSESSVTLWPLWTNCYVSSTSHSKLLRTSSNAAVPYYVRTLIFPLVWDILRFTEQFVRVTCELRASEKSETHVIIRRMFQWRHNNIGPAKTGVRPLRDY